jgi:hypothetical protein
MTPKLADGYLFIPAWGLFIGERLSHSPSAERRGKGTLKEGEPMEKGENEGERQKAFELSPWRTLTKGEENIKPALWIQKQY